MCTNDCYAVIDGVFSRVSVEKIVYDCSGDKATFTFHTDAGVFDSSDLYKSEVEFKNGRALHLTPERRLPTDLMPINDNEVTYYIIGKNGLPEEVTKQITKVIYHKGGKVEYPELDECRFATRKEAFAFARYKVKGEDGKTEERVGGGCKLMLNADQQAAVEQLGVALQHLRDLNVTLIANGAQLLAINNAGSEWVMCGNDDDAVSALNVEDSDTEHVVCLDPEKFAIGQCPEYFWEDDRIFVPC